ncbi:MAG: ATPase, partial [Armatimonadota bacterium]|nr:ATPase [Armatimonadota bacterium]
GLRCPRLHVNDAVVAHAGAFQSQPGIIAIAGTGSIVFGKTETGQHIRNFDFNHYAYCSALHLSYEAIHRLLAGDILPEDREFMDEVLAFWGAKAISELRERGVRGFVADDFECNRTFGDMAPLVTERARRGAPLARSVCDGAAEALGIGVRLVGACFAARTVRVALVGGVVKSDYMQGAVARVLAKSREVQYQLVEPAFPGEIGAVLMALEQQNVAMDETALTA